MDVLDYDAGRRGDQLGGFGWPFPDTVQRVVCSKGQKRDKWGQEKEHGSQVADGSALTSRFSFQAEGTGVSTLRRGSIRHDCRNLLMNCDLRQTIRHFQSIK